LDLNWLARFVKLLPDSLHFRGRSLHPFCDLSVCPLPQLVSVRRLYVYKQHVLESRERGAEPHLIDRALKSKWEAICTSNGLKRAVFTGNLLC